MSPSPSPSPSPMEEHGSGWTARAAPGFTYEYNRQYARLVMETLENQAPLMLPRPRPGGDSDGE